MKLLYTFKHKLANGEEIKLAIRKPTRLEIDDADMMFSRFQSECIKNGIMTKEMLIKSYKNFGGTMSNQEEKEYSKIFSSFADARVRLEKCKTKKERSLIEKEIEVYYSSLRDIEMEHEHLFDRTADVIARNRTITHLTMLLGLKDVSEDGDSEPIWEKIYAGDEFDERYQDFSDKEELDPDNAAGILGRVSFFVTFWYFGDKSLTEEDFKKYDELTRADFDEFITSE